MDELPTKKTAEVKPKATVDYQLLDRLVEDNPNLSDAQILQLYQQHHNTPQVTVALLSDDLNDATKVILASALPDQKEPTSTQSQAQYLIDRKIDSGGQSHVYLAHRNDGTYHKTVVIKVLNQSIEGDTQKQQLMAEMQILADLKHPNIVSILDAGIDDQHRPWLMLEFIPGEHINEFIKHHNLTHKQLSWLFISLAKALKYIHQNKVVHADIKPANILVEMLDGFPQPVIIDFGIATTDGNDQPVSPYIFATPAFASPEQLAVNLHAVDHRSDIYSLGQLMKFLLDSQAARQPATQWVNHDLAAILTHCLAAEPSHRYQDMQSLITDLERHSKGDAVSVVQLSAGQHLSRKIIKHKMSLFIMTFVVGVALLLIVNIFNQNNQNQALIKGAASNQKYWQSADEISNQTRLIYALPKRNIEPDFKALNLQFVTLLSQIENAPVTTQNLAFLPLADAAISLGQFHKAQDLLLKAYANTPGSNEVKFKLGKNYLILYQNEVQSLKNFSLPEQRQVQLKRLQKKYFEPAKELLNPTSKPIYEDQLIPSLLHYFEGNYALALKQLALSESQLLWPIDRLLLSAQITQEQANQFLHASKLGEAIALLNQVFDILLEAKQIARSHPEVYKQLCQTESQLMQLQQQNTSVINNCDELLEILPETSDALLIAAEAYAQMAKSWLDRGQSPIPLLQHSRAILNQAWEQQSDTNYAQAEQIKGHLLSTEGKWQLYSNQAFTQSFKQAIEHHQQAAQIQPNNYTYQLDLATAWYNLANNARYTYNQTDHYFDQATHILTNLITHADSTEFLPNFLVKVYTEHAYIRYQNGYAADQQLNQAEILVEQFKSKTPDSPYAQQAVATLYWTYTDYMVLQDKDPQPYLAQAIEAFDQVIGSDPSRWTVRYNQISAMLSGVTFNLQHGTTQRTTLEAINDKLEHLEAQISDAIALDSHWGYYYNMVAIDEMLSHKNPSESLKQAWYHNDLCAESPIDGYLCFSQLATSLLTETKWNIENPQQRIDFHKDHIIKLNLALKTHPDHHQLMATFGQYLWLTTQHQATNNQRTHKDNQSADLEQAKILLKQAITGNPLLTERLKADLAAIETAIQN